MGRVCDHIKGLHSAISHIKGNKNSTEYVIRLLALIDREWGAQHCTCISGNSHRISILKYGKIFLCPPSLILAKLIKISRVKIYMYNIRAAHKLLTMYSHVY